MEQLFAFDRDRRSNIIAMDPERARVYNENFKKYAWDRVSISHIDVFWCVPFRCRVWSAVMALRRNSS
jgi:hypothetical protein